ncbi:MAG: response regulator [Saprospiraceae bacterium]|nr:response regulator [Saprospiraceae bacterium]
MLDLSKLESGKLALHPVQGDVVLFLKYLLESFQSLAASKSISLHFHSAMDTFTMDYDEERLRQIVSNLLSNAVKFTSEGGQVVLNVGRVQNPADVVVLTVTDTGTGIPSDKLPLIFDRFYQADDAATRRGEGTGIGLALTKELVKLLGGTIEVKSELGKGTEFKVRLPVSRTADLRFIPTEVGNDLRLDEPEMILQSEAAPPIVNRKSEIENQLPLVLVVEDNPDVQGYLANCLEEKYQVELANDGQVGIERAIELIPDLVITDVMMPGVDGLELCQTLKNDERTSHIPIVLLTAKADIESKIEGLEHGADAYLAKPFHQKELFVRLEKLLELRKTLQARYGSWQPVGNMEFPVTEQVIPHSSFLIPNREEAFLQKVRLIIESHLSDEDYDVVQLSRELGMSRSQLFRKMKALTDKSIANFIRSYRLHRAKQMLETTDLTVAEIAYEVGFKDPSYFTKTFFEEFGVLPSSFRH